MRKNVCFVIGLLMCLGVFLPAVQVRAAASDLELDLANFAGYLPNNNLLDLDGYANYTVGNGDGGSIDMADFDGERLSVTSELPYGTVRITNRFIEEAEIGLISGGTVALKDIPMLYMAKVTFDATPSQPWQGGGIGLGQTAGGYSVSIRLQYDKSSHLIARTAQSEDSSAPHSGNMPRSGEQGESFDVAVIKDGNRFTVYIDGERKSKDIGYPSADRNIDKIWFSILSAENPMSLSEMRLIPLAEVILPSVQIADGNENAAEYTSIKLEAVGSTANGSAGSKVADGNVWMQNHYIDWRYSLINERSLTAVSSFTLNFSTLTDDSNMAVTLKAGGEEDAVIFNIASDGGISLMQGETVLQQAHIGAALQEGADYPFRVVAGLARVSVYVGEELMLRQATNSGVQSNILEFLCEDADLLVQDISIYYAERVFFEQPDYNRYPESEGKAEANTDIITPTDIYKLPWLLFAVGVLMIAGSVVLFIALKKNILTSTAKSKNEEAQK